jgi:transketolase
MAAGSMAVSSLCVVVDLNEMQVEGHTDRVLRQEPVADKWAAFGWNVIATDGHDIRALLGALDAAGRCPDRPTVILARTLVGKGVDFLEGQFGHNMKLSPEDAERALRALGAPVELAA